MSAWGFLKDAKDNLIEWWKQDKISGTIMPIFLVLNGAILWTRGDWTVNQLIANASMLAVMIWSIREFRIKTMAENKDRRMIQKEMDVEMKMVDLEHKENTMKLELERDRFEHKREMETFSKNIVEREHAQKMVIIEEQADFVEKAIQGEISTLMFMNQYMDMADEHVHGLADKHMKQIEELREYKKALPDIIHMRLKDVYNLRPPQVQTSGEMVQNELSNVLSQIKNNTQVTEAYNEIKLEELPPIP